jgi:hypothetical protein
MSRCRRSWRDCIGHREGGWKSLQRHCLVSKFICPLSQPLVLFNEGYGLFTQPCGLFSKFGKLVKIDQVIPPMTPFSLSGASPALIWVNRFRGQSC